MGERPGALGGARLVIDAVVDAGIAQILVGAREAPGQLLGAERVERCDAAASRPGAALPSASTISSGTPASGR